MNISDLSGLDLNLLVTFHVLMQERNVTRTAVKLHVSQSAVSASLARMRSFTNDTLFERSKHGMQPTPRAIELAGPVALALGHLAKSLYPDEVFSPTESHRTFHLAMSDDIESVLAPWLLEQSLREKWQVKFAFHQTNSHLYEQSLANERIDLVLAATPAETSSLHRSRVLFSGSYACMFSAEMHGGQYALSEREFREATHLRVSYGAQRGFIDEVLESSGIQRSVPLSLSHFSGVVAVLRQHPVIVTLPDFAARSLARASGLTVTPVPVTVPTFTVSAIWRETDASDSARAWLLTLVDSFQLPHDGS